MSAERILVTGASGFIGGHLVAHLLRRGVEVIAPVRSRPARQDGARYEQIASIENADWRPLLAGVDAVVHCAGLAHVRGLPDEALYGRINALAAARLAEQCAGRVGRFVFLSSIRAMVGAVEPGLIDEARPPAPTDAYGRSKLAAERAIAALDLSSVSLRPVAVYGPGVKGNIARIARLADSALPLPLAGLRAPRSFLALSNLMSAIYFALTGEEGGARTFIVSDPELSNIADFVAGLREGLGRPARLFAAPRGSLGAAARMAGRGQSWQTLAGPLPAPPASLLAAGWRPAVPTSRAGARAWGAEMRRAAGR